MVKLLDCTTRDGGHIFNWEFDDEYIFNYLNFLNENNIHYYEIGYRNYYETDGKGQFYRCMPNLLDKFYRNKGNLKLGVMTDTRRYNSDDFQGQEQDKIDFVRIAVHPDSIKDAIQISENLYGKGYLVFIQLMDVTNIDTLGYLKLYQWDKKYILESIYFADSYSKLSPNDIAKYYNKLKVLGFNKISFHAHNNTGYALDNSIEAIKLGVYSVDTTKDGIGRNGGNLNFEDLKTFITDKL